VKTTKRIFLLLLIILPTTFYSCEDDNGISEETIRINKFVWDNMNNLYFWNEQIPGHLNYKKEPDTKKFFDKLIYDQVDQWSFITDDYDGLVNYFAGISKSMGHSLRLFKVSENSDDVVGFIEYVEPNSPADRASLYRGQMFYKINGQKLTTENVSDLLSKDSYSMTFGSLNGNGSINELSPAVKLNAVELQSNPILLHKVIEHGGVKVGYLVYTSFVEKYNDELKSVFAEFKSQGVDHLVLDLRYNSGGSVTSAILLSSLIAPASKAGDVLLRTTYNDILTQYFDTKEADNPDRYIDRITPQEHNLNLNKVVVLSTFKTASASEMIIYGLDPHMNVYHIGEQTRGKYYGSNTFSDPNKSHNWAIQPIIMRAENKTNSINYTEGLIPDQKRTDFINASTIYELGDPKEDFLAQALLHLTGQLPVGASLKSATPKSYQAINNESSFSNPLHYDMQYDIKK